MLKFLSLGSGSSGNCYVLFTDNTCLMIDAGISMRAVKKHLKGCGLRPEAIDAIFITHDHADHIKAVGNISNEFGKPVYATEAVHKGIRHSYCVTCKLAEDNIRYVRKGEPVAVGDFSVTPFEVPHDSTDCVGYRVEAGGTVFCLITDVGHITETLQCQVKDAEYLVLEANHDEDMLMMGNYPAYLKGRIRGERGHLSNRDSARLIAENASGKLRRVWLCHISEENNHPELARKTVESVLHGYGIVPGVDFGVDILRRKTPSEIYELTP